MSRLPGEIDGRRFLRAMARFGWTVRRQRGSHRRLVHPDRPNRITVSFHDTIGRTIVRKILRHAGIDEDEFLKAL
jgi:predicted RNA binding protein YcfA (HicA-like mRNA interferase family)